MLQTSPTLTNEMNSLHRKPASQLTVEQYLPEWEPRITGLSPGKFEQYALGHAAVLIQNGNGAGNDIIFRVRVGSFADPQSSFMYVASIKGADLGNAAGWESLWVDSTISDAVYPAWISNSGANYGGALAAAVDTQSQTVRVFYFSVGGYIKFADFNYNGVLLTSGSIASHPVDASMQLASCRFDEVFVSSFQQVEPGYASWHKPIYGTRINRYYYSSGWQSDGSFLFHTHAESILKNTQDYDAPNEEIVAQWGKRLNGGLAANQIGGNIVVVSFGVTFWRRWGYNTHSQGLMSFLYYRDSGLWQRGLESGVADYAKSMRVSYDTFAKNSIVDDANFIVWSRNDEPLDIEQADGNERIPRLREVVYAKIDPTGKYITQFQSLGPQDDLTGASIVAARHGTSKYLFAIGWRGVYESIPASFVCTVPDSYKAYLDVSSNAVNVTVDNAYGMTINFDLIHCAVLFNGSVVKSGNLLRAYYGIEGELVQVAQAYLDMSNPVIKLRPAQHTAKPIARADKPLMDTRAESINDILPQSTRDVPPDKPIKYVSRHAGYWSLEQVKWPALFFPGEFPNMVDKLVYQCQSSMEAFTGGSKPGGGEVAPGVYGNGGKIWETKLHKKGSFYSDIVWLAHSPMIDGSIQTSTRMGDNIGQQNFAFNSTNGCPVSAAIVRQSGLIQRIDWSTHDCDSAPDGVWNRVAQESTMTGVICHAVEVGKKYAFVWEANSNFPQGSHLEDQAGRYWNSLVFDAPDFGAAGRPPNLSGTVGRNKLYLVLSDYDESTPEWTKPADRVNDPNWQNNQRWIHRYVAGGIDATGLTVGKPAELKMQVLGGTIHCFYRPYTEPTKSLWRHAFSYQAGRFGAGKFGIVGRGHSGIQWDALWEGRNYINRCDNVVDFWDIRMSDNIMDQTMQDCLSAFTWQGLTTPMFRTLVDEESIFIPADTLSSAFDAPPLFATPLAIENLTIDFELEVNTTGGEAGVWFRATNHLDPQQDCIYLGLRVGSTYKAGDNTLNCYAVKRVFSGGLEQTSHRDYSPSPLHLRPDTKLPCRITVRGNLFTIWVAGNQIGHFGYYNETEAPPPELAKSYYFGLYTIGSSATYRKIKVPELYEIPTYSLLDVNQTMRDAITKLVGKRRIKGVYQPDGSLLFSYFSWHDTLPTFSDLLIQNEYKMTDRFYSVCHVEGAYTYAVYSSPALLGRGRRFIQAHNPDLMLAEHCYREARMIVQNMAEQMEQATFVGPLDIRIRPEDAVPIIVAQQDINNVFLVESISLQFDMAKRKSLVIANTRKEIEID